jgi:hypothetical protein
MTVPSGPSPSAPCAPPRAAPSTPSPAGPAAPPPGQDSRAAPPRGQDARATLAARQEALVATLVAGAEIPSGFDVARIAATRRALLRKRAGEVAAAWPLLAGSLGDAWIPRFTAWAAGRPPRGSAADGLEFAQTLQNEGTLPPPAATELTARTPTIRH